VSRKGGRPSKTAQEASQSFKGVLDRIEPDVLLAGMLGATASLGGVTPPFTLLLRAMGLSANATTAIVSESFANPTKPGWQILRDYFSGDHGNESALVPGSQNALVVGLAAAGALEGMMMMTLMKNPATVEALGKIISSGIEAAASAGKGAGGALLGAL